MTDREKLIDILSSKNRCPENVHSCMNCPYHVMAMPGHCDEDSLQADRLLANGVTFQKWIPVNEGCPTAHSGCIVYRNNNLGSHYSMVTYTPALGFHYYDSEYGDITLDDITHWMPLPEPPKEEK